MDNRYLTVKETAQRLRVSPRLVYKLIARGDIRAVRVSQKAIRIALQEIERFERERLEMTKMNDVYKSIVHSLIALLNHEDRHIGRSARLVVRQIGKTVLPVLIETINDKESPYRTGAARAISSIVDAEDAEAIPTLLEMTRDEDDDVRTWAAIGLGKIGDPQAVPALIETLKDSSNEVRRASAEALGAIGDPQAVPALIEVLKDENSLVRGYSAKALGAIGDPQAVPALIEAIKDTSKDIRQEAAESLVRIGKPALPALTEAIGTADPKTRYYLYQVRSKIKRDHHQ